MALLVEQVFDSDSLYQLREAVAAHAAWAGMPPGRVADIVIVVHELAANVIRHGAGRGRLRMFSQDGGLCCQVAGEHGAKQAGAAVTNPARADGSGRRENAAADALPWAVERGHGLWMVDQLADELSFGRDASGYTATVRFLPGPVRPDGG
jgi:anti-sigma regulatory factor (Ser/Thr protein kinase)